MAGDGFFARVSLHKSGMKKFDEYLQRSKRMSREDLMRAAILAAERGRSQGDYPVGAVVAWEDSYFSDHNTVFSEQDHTNHAEMNVMRKASETSFKKMKYGVLYSTVEPYIMCATAAWWNGIREIVFGAYDPQNGFVSSQGGILCESFNLQYAGGLLAQECYELLPEVWKEFVCVEPQMEENDGYKS